MIQKSLIFVFRLERECVKCDGQVFPEGYYIHTHLVYGYCPETHKWGGGYASEGFSLKPEFATLMEVTEVVVTTTKTSLWKAP